MFIALAAPPEQEDYFIGLSHTERAWVAVDELVPLLKALTTANRQKRATQKPTLNMLIPTLSPHITHGKAGIQ